MSKLYKYKMLTIPVYPEYKDYLKELARRRGMTMSQLIKAAINQYIPEMSHFRDIFRATSEASAQRETAPHPGQPHSQSPLD